MVNEEIVTVLRNAVNKGDSLQHAIQVLVNSGYDAQQVQEASKYVQGGSMQNLQPKPDEQLIMAQNKNLLNRQQPNQQNPQMQQNQMTQQQRTQSQQRMQQAMNQPKQPMNQLDQMQQIKPTNEKDPFASQPVNQNEIQKLAQPMNPQTPTVQPMAQPNMQQNTTQQPRNFQDPTQKEKPPEIKIKKKSHKKEIILLIILLALIGILASTIFFRESILKFLSG